ncbi:MAG: CapA family protein [Synergistaceae bacterium]|nr:CapA family protein [Synergistaceae bacterium]
MKIFRRIAAAALAALLISAPAWGGARFSLIAAGDALIHRGVYNAAALKKGGYDFRPMLRFIKSRVAAHDIAFYNQETILGGVKLGLSTYPCFNSPREVGDAFLDAGFNLVSLANNHTLDRGEKGVLASLEYWEDKEGAVRAGSYADKEASEEVSMFEAGGIKCAFLAYTTATNGLKAPKGKEYYVNVYSPEKVKKDVEKARKEKADAVIVSMHWGSEYVFEPAAEQKKIAKHLASLGVNLVIGHHPHVVQPAAMIDDTLVIYSLGNFISAQKELYKLIGLMVSLDVVKTEKDGKARITFENVTGTLTYNPRNSVHGRYVIVPFDMMTEAVLKNYPAVYKKYADIVKGKGDWKIAMRPAAPLPRKAKAKK